MTKKCPFCGNKTVPNLALDQCTVCGIETNHETVAQMARMTPEWRAHFIGYHHASETLPYGWKLPPMSRAEIRSYARGYMAALSSQGRIRGNTSENVRRAYQDASWTGKPTLEVGEARPVARKKTANDCTGCDSSLVVVRICMDSLDPLLFHGVCLMCGKEGAKGATREAAERRWNRANPVTELALA